MKRTNRWRPRSPLCVGSACLPFGRAPFARSLVWLGLACMPAIAQDATISRPLSLVPTFNATASFSDVRNRSGGNEPGQLILQAGPGLQLTRRSGSVQGTLDYSLVGTMYSRRSELNSLQNNLTAFATAEAVEGWAYVDARATITQQSVSAFGQQTAPGSLNYNSNQREVLNVVVSPYVRGELRGLADYEVRVFGTMNEISGETAGDYRSGGSSVSLSSPRRGSVIGWGLQASQDQVNFKGGRATDNARASASVSYSPSTDLALVLRGGQESTNVGGVDRRSYDNWGAGLRWTPTPRTQVSLSADRRYFGNSHQVSLEHRLRSSSIRFTSSRDVISGNDSSGLGRPVTLFQYYMTLPSYVAAEPNVQLRALRVLELLKATNQNPNAVVGGGFATSAVSVQRRDDLIYTYVTPRSTFTVLGFSSSTDVLDNLSAQRGLGAIRQSGVLASVSHRVTPITNVSLQGTFQRSSGQNQPDSDLKSLSLGLATSLNRNTTASVGLRLGVNSSANNSNRETALTASLGMRF